MRRRFQCMNKEHGFVLPYVMFVASIIFIILATNITIFESEQTLTVQHLEQLKIETMIQSALIMVKQDLIGNNGIQNIDYTLPDGNINMSITKLTESEYHLFMTINTESSPAYTIVNRLFIPDN